MFIKQRAIEANHRSAGACPLRSLWDSQRPFTNQRPVSLSCACFKECLKGGAHGGFVRYPELLILFEGGVVSRYYLMRWFEVKCWHRCEYSIFWDCISRKNQKTYADEPGRGFCHLRPE